MTLEEKIVQLRAVEGKTRLRVTLLDGTVFTGLYTEYADAEDNVEGVASIDIEVAPGEPEYCLMENEIKEIIVV